MTNNTLSILKSLTYNESKSVTEIAKLISIPKRTIQSNLKNLVEVKRVNIKGTGKSTKYILSKSYIQEFQEILYIYQNQNLIGYLGYDYENYLFAYDTDYILEAKHAARFEMGLDLKIYKQPNCYVDFEETLPEGIDKDILIEKTGNATEFFLLKNNNYSSNDLVFSDKILEFEKPLEPISYLSLKKEILGENNFPNVLSVDIKIDEQTLYPSNFLDKEEELKTVRTISLSGFQHKFQVILKDKTLSVANNEHVVEYFVKPYNPQKANPNSDFYFPHIAINEHLHLTFAKNELGLDAPYSGIFKSKEDSEYHFIIKYFDRYKGYKFQRKEFSTHMGLSSEGKYKTSSEKLFSKVAQVLPRKEDRLKILEYYFYSFMIRHEDMHTKNLSNIIDNGKTILAPIYDIATTSFYDNIKNYESHLAINGKQTQIRYNDFLHIVKNAKVNPSDFKESTKNILQIYIDKMPSYIDRIKDLDNAFFYHKSKANASGKKQKILNRRRLEEVMLEAFEKRVETLQNNNWIEKLGIKL